MDIRILNLTIQNFKGIRDASFSLDGMSVNIIGDNGLGKSTIFDAFTWLLFGKDHRNNDQSKFEIVPIDPVTGEQVHHLETVVEAALSTNGVKTTLRRVWRETWSRAKKETESKLTGHESLFFINGMNVDTLANYNAYIKNLIDEKIFRLITDPLFFIGETTDKKSRRAALMTLVGDNIDKSAIREKYADIIAQMNGEDVSTFRRRIAAEKREAKRLLAECDPKISGYTDSLPVPEDYAAIEQELDDAAKRRDEVLESIKAQIAEVDAAILDAKKADAAAIDARSAKRRELAALKDELQKMTDDATLDAKRANAERDRRIKDAENCSENARLRAKNAESRSKTAVMCANDDRKELQRVTEMVQSCKAEIEKIKARAFTYQGDTVCPACGQVLPDENIEAAREKALAAFTESNLREIESYKTRAMSFRPRYDEISERIKANEDRAALAERELAKINEEIIASDAVLAEARALPVVDIATIRESVVTRDDYVKLSAEIGRLEADLGTVVTTDVSDVLARRKELESEQVATLRNYESTASALKGRLAKRDEAARIKSKIAAVEDDKKNLTERLASLERMEFEAGEYLKADIASVEDAINGMFKIARFRMFDTLVNGDVVEDCTALDLQNVPYGSMNDAKRILVGMDVIAAFCRAYDVTAPIFVDNAESITISEFDVESQVVRLSVVKGATLSIEK